MTLFTRKPSHLFVCGCPRSGTSGVAAWLGSSSDIAIGMERYQRYWSTHLTLPEGAFEESRFFNVVPEDTWYDSIEHFSEALWVVT